MNNIFDLAGGRKMVLSLLSLVALTVLAYTKPEAITTEFVTALIGLVTAFSASNVINTIKGVYPTEPNVNVSSIKTELSNTSPTLTTNAPITDMAVDSLAEEVKVSNLALQSQIDDINSRIERLADIIQKTLTASSMDVNVSVANQQPPTAAERSLGANGSAAEFNRQAINQFLSKSIIK